MDTCLFPFLIFQTLLLKPLVLALLGPGSAMAQVPTDPGSLWFAAVDRSSSPLQALQVAASSSFQPHAGWLP